MDRLQEYSFTDQNCKVSIMNKNKKKMISLKESTNIHIDSGKIWGTNW
jgi:hypothetical protein